MVQMKKILEYVQEQVGMVTYTLPPSKMALGEKDFAPDVFEKTTPTLTLMMLLEGLVLARKAGDHSARYTFNDTLANIAAGASQQAFMAAFFAVLPVSELYRTIHKKYRLVSYDVKKWPVLTWLGLFLSVDCCFYWAHRLCHVMHVPWAGHSVHHSGEEYNMSTALRQGVLQYVFTWIQHMPLALIFPFPAFSMHNQMNTTYQFWTHTEVIGSLGPLDLHTPPHAPQASRQLQLRRRADHLGSHLWNLCARD
jgi:alkylglycerol monooxygenase